MELLNALEDMATRLSTETTEPDPQTIERWQTLFCLPDCYASIMEFRQALDPPTVTDEHWAEVSTKMKAQGHDRESYTYSLSLNRCVSNPSTKKRSSGRQNGWFLLQLHPHCPPIATPEAVQAAANLRTPPRSEMDEKHGGQFVRLPGTAKDHIEALLTEFYPHVRPIFARLTLPATKELHAASLHPTLGVEATLPHHRFACMRMASDRVVQQNQFPVWYFFYGTLADRQILERKLDMREDQHVSFLRAKVRNARLTIWGGKYKALVPGTDTVQGSAYLVRNETDEEKLRAYETDHYEVVWCEVELEDRVENGLTFKYVEPE